MIVTILKAHPIGDVPTTTIQIGPDSFPDLPQNGPFDDWLRQSIARHEIEASAIVTALRASLPGGTFDAVLRKMLEAKASALRVPFDGAPGRRDEQEGA